MKKINKLSKENLENLYIRRKMTTYQIAEYYKSSQATIWESLHRYNILLRKRDLIRLFELFGYYLKHAKKIKDLEKAKKNIIERNKKFDNL